jgi:hypothetical protein
MFGEFSEEALSAFYASFADAPSVTQKDCGPGERVVFGKCAKGDNMGNKQIDEAQKKERQSDKPSDNSKPVMVNGKRMGWAVLNGKKVLVDYGSVAGEKKVGPKQPSAKQKSPAETAIQNSNRINGLRKALANQANEAGREAIRQQIIQLGGNA